MSDCQELVEAGWKKKLKLFFWSGLYQFWGMVNPCKLSTTTYPTCQASGNTYLSGSRVSLSLSLSLTSGNLWFPCWTGHRSPVQVFMEIQPGRAAAAWCQYFSNTKQLLTSFLFTFKFTVSMFSLQFLRESVNSDLGHSFLWSMEPTSATEKQFSVNWGHMAQHSADLVSS